MSSIAEKLFTEFLDKAGEPVPEFFRPPPPRPKKVEEEEPPEYPANFTF